MVARFVIINHDTPMRLPPALREWLPADHMVRFVMEAVAVLDLKAARVNKRETESAKYPPARCLANEAKPRIRRSSPRNAFSLRNALTEAFKTVSPHTAFGHKEALHGLFDAETDMALVSGLAAAAGRPR